jgi:general secretion pathway protein D
VRLLDGETQILGGLISSGDRNTASKIPGLGQLPIAGRLFSNNNGNDNKTEIVLSITPRILRAPATLDPSLRNIFSGTEGNMRERAMQLEPMGAARLQSSSSTPAATTGGTSRTVSRGAAPAPSAVNTSPVDAVAAPSTTPAEPAPTQ